MKRKAYSRRKRTTTKSVLRLPDLEHAKAAGAEDKVSVLDECNRDFSPIDEAQV